MQTFCKKILPLTKLRGSWYYKVYLLKLHMRVHLPTKFQVSSIILTSFRQEGVGWFCPTLYHKTNPYKTHWDFREIANFNKAVHIIVFLSSFIYFLCYSWKQGKCPKLTMKNNALHFFEVIIFWMFPYIKSKYGKYYYILHCIKYVTKPLTVFSRKLHRRYMRGCLQLSFRQNDHRCSFILYIGSNNSIYHR